MTTTKQSAQPYEDLTPAELNRLIIKCRRALFSHMRSEETQGAFEATIGTLRDIEAVAPASIKLKVRRLLNRHGYDLPLTRRNEQRQRET